MSKGIAIACNEQADGIGRLEIRGNLTLRNATVMKQALTESMEKYSPLHINISDVSSIDISVIQLIYAAKKSGQQTQWNISLPEDIKTLLIRAGMEDIML